MIRKIITIALITCPILFGKTFSVEALYGIGNMSTTDNGNKVSGTLHDIGLRGILFTDMFVHELVGRSTVKSDIELDFLGDKIPVKYRSIETEYRFGGRMENEMEKFGMLSGSAYVGIGYQNITAKVDSFKGETNFIYLPFGFWGEDDSGITNLKIRYGLNLKTMLFDDSEGKKGEFKYNFLFGGKVYAGVGYTIGNIVDVFSQVFFSYNTPVKSLKSYGLEVGVQF